MEITASASEWLFTDAEKLSAFLDTETGKRFLPKLAELTPELLDRGDTNAILIRSGEVRGIRAVIQNIFLLAHPAPAANADSGEYPSLTDDRAWNDGQKIE